MTASRPAICSCSRLGVIGASGNPLVPAEAGTQFFVKHWMPAFAGMSGDNGVAMALLEVKGLRRRFGGVMALDGADLSVEQGRITGLIGPNGAGKTTLFNAVTGALRPSEGHVYFAGTDVTGWRPDRLADIGLSRTFQIARGLAQLTVIENLMLYGKHQPGETFCAAVLRTQAARAREEELRVRAIEVARELNLLEVGDNRAVDLSGGQKKLLELGRALMAEPKLIMLDEPAAGINPTLAKKLGEHILALKARGVTFLIIEHNMGLVAALCDHVVVLVQGKRFTEGRFADLRSDPRVQEAYMGHRA
jgi:ABC-type branched-subunit amino acid transport system ATPase component